jgi:hypothetical protein
MPTKGVRQTLRRMGWSPRLAGVKKQWIDNKKM